MTTPQGRRLGFDLWPRLPRLKGPTSRRGRRGRPGLRAWSESPPGVRHSAVGPSAPGAAAAPERDPATSANGAAVTKTVTSLGVALTLAARAAISARATMAVPR